MQLSSTVLLLVLNFSFGNGQSQEYFDRVRKYGAELDNILVNKIVREFTGLNALEEKYKSIKLTIIERNTTEIVQQKVDVLKKILMDKEELVKRIVKKAENLRNVDDPGPLTGGNITFLNTTITTDSVLESGKLFYRNAKCNCQHQRPEDVPASNCTKPKAGYETSRHFGEYPVSYEQTSIHIPTEVFNEDPDVLRDIYLSHGIDDIMKSEVCSGGEFSNFTRWVYYTTQSGAMRFFPDRIWTDDCDTPDVYDSRVSPWFVNSVSSPKDVVVLIDNSGSVKGLTLNLLHRSVKDLLATLTTNDYVNIVLFNEEAQFIGDRCSGLLQATPRNKQILRNWMNVIETGEQAFYDKGFDLVLKTLHDAQQADVYSAKCNPTVMFFTDGDSTYPTTVINKWNADGNKRIFSFVVGKNFYGKEITKEIACQNRGYYYGIPSYTATKSSVQKYLIKLSEPLTDRLNKIVSWTLPYRDKLGLGFVLSASAPVEDFEPAVENEEEKKKVAGVVGTDLLLDDLKKILTEPDMGQDYYPFVLDNNGFVVLHPNLIEANHDEMITVDFSELERGDLMSVRRDIIDGRSGAVSVSKELLVDKKYILTSTYKFDYAPLNGTVFKLGLGVHNSKLKFLDAVSALATNYSSLTLQKLVDDQSSDTTALLYSSICEKRNLEGFNPCKAGNDTDEDPEDSTALKDGVPLSDFKPDDSCETASQLYASLLLHGILSDEAMTVKWENDSAMRDGHGVLATFAALETPSFVRTKYLNFSRQTNGEIEGDEELVKKEIEAILANPRGSSYMQRAIHSPSSGWTIFSFVEPPTIDELHQRPTSTAAPSTEGSTMYEAISTVFPTDPTATMQTSTLVKRVRPGYILASKVVKVVENENDVAPVVTGVVLHPDTFQRNLFHLDYKCNGSAECRTESWHFMCNDTENMECILLDEGGFLLASNQEKHYEMINDFFGLIDGEFTRALIEGNVYAAKDAYDYQALCLKVQNDKSAGIPRCFVPTIADFMSIAWWVSSCSRVFFYSFFQSLVLGFWTLVDLGSSFVILPNETELSAGEQEPCILKKTILSYGPNSHRSFVGTFACTETCSRTYTVVRLDDTNLLLIVVPFDSDCRKCTKVAPYGNEEVDVTIEETCNNKTVRYRKPPEEDCYDARTYPVEKDSPCSSAQFVHPLYTILAIFSALPYILRHFVLR